MSEQGSLLDPPEQTAAKIVEAAGPDLSAPLRSKGICDACGQPLPGISRAVDENVVEVGRSGTAQAMRARALPRSGSFRRALCDLLAGMADGMTDYEIEDLYGKSHQAASGARSTLKADGWIMPLLRDGIVVTRTNRYGNEAAAWTLTPAAREALAE